MKKEHTKKKRVVHYTPHAPKARAGVAERKPELERLLAEGKQEEAKQLLRDMLSAPLTDEERGAILVGFAAAYLALSNQVNEARRDALQEEVEALESIAKMEKEVGEKLELAKVRASL